MWSVSLVLVALALGFCVLAAAGKLALWPAVFCLILERLITAVPPR